MELIVFIVEAVVISTIIKLSLRGKVKTHIVKNKYLYEIVSAILIIGLTVVFISIFNSSEQLYVGGCILGIVEGLYESFINREKDN